MISRFGILAIRRIKVLAFRLKMNTLFNNYLTTGRNLVIEIRPVVTVIREYMFNDLRAVSDVNDFTLRLTISHNTHVP
jgi:hypothetical protein